jgi:glycosyltransferase involved in cell wall biosynthesis
MVELARRLPDIDLHVLGGPAADAEALRALPERPAGLHVHGLRPVADAERLQAAMDVLLAPYARSVATPGGVDTSRWMSPMKVFEYLAAGRAVVCSDLPALREVLEDDVTAVLVDPEDVDAWVDAVERLRDDATVREQLGARGRAVHAERFTWEARTRRLLDVWGAVTGAAPGTEDER